MKRLALLLFIGLLTASALAGGLRRSTGAWNEVVSFDAIPGSADTITWILPSDKANGVQFSVQVDTAGLDTSTTTPASTYATITIRNLNFVASDSSTERLASGTPWGYGGILTASGVVDSATLGLDSLYLLSSDSTNINGQPKAIQMIVTVSDSLTVYIRSNFGSN